MARSIKRDILIVTEPVTKESIFFAKGCPLNLAELMKRNQISKEILNWILEKMPDVIPAFQGKLQRVQLTEVLVDHKYSSAFSDELGSHSPLSIEEFIAIVCDLLTKQLNGEDGDLFTLDGNTFFVQFENRVVKVTIYWALDHSWVPGHSVGRWYLTDSSKIDDFGGIFRSEPGRCFFIRN